MIKAHANSAGAVVAFAFKGMGCCVLCRFDIDIARNTPGLRDYFEIGQFIQKRSADRGAFAYQDQSVKAFGEADCQLTNTDRAI